MFRKKKHATPDFRMPSPYDGVSDRRGPLSASKPLCRFKLKETLTTSDDRAEAYILNQYSTWGIHSYSDKIVVWNLLKSDGDYKFEGEIDDTGLAFWDSGYNWIIVEMQSGSHNFYLGKVTGSAIASEGTGTVIQHEQLWVPTSPAVTFTVLNPHDIELPVDLKVRWSKYPGWSDWIVEPWHWTECP